MASSQGAVCLKKQTIAISHQWGAVCAQAPCWIDFCSAEDTAGSQLRKRLSAHWIQVDTISLAYVYRRLPFPWALILRDREKRKEGQVILWSQDIWLWNLLPHSAGSAGPECGIGDKICSALERRNCCSVQGVELPLKGYYISCLMLRSGWEHSVWWQGLQIMSVSLKCKD